MIQIPTQEVAEEILLTTTYSAFLVKSYLFGATFLTQSLYSPAVCFLGCLVLQLLWKHHDNPMEDHIATHKRESSSINLIYNCFCHTILATHSSSRSSNSSDHLFNTTFMFILTSLCASSLRLSPSRNHLFYLYSFLFTFTAVFSFSFFDTFTIANVYNSLFFTAAFAAAFHAFLFTTGRSFSVGESALLAQLCALLWSTEIPQQLPLPIISCLLVTKLTSIFFTFLTTITHLFQQNPTHSFYATLVLLTPAFTAYHITPISLIALSLQSFSSYNFSIHTILLLAYWLLLCLCCFYFTTRAASASSLRTVTRKVYHVFLLLVFVPGLILDPLLLLFCSSILTCVFFITSLIIAYKIPPLGELLSEAVKPYTSSQDTGQFVLTPVYLLLGSSSPLWLHYYRFSSGLIVNINQPHLPIAVYSGLLSVGVGDAVASVVGSKYGKRKVFGTNKTLEGVAASVVSQMGVLFLFHLFLGYTFHLWHLFTVVVVSLAELVTTEIDNLVLPLLMYMLLM